MTNDLNEVETTTAPESAPELAALLAQNDALRNEVFALESALDAERRANRETNTLLEAARRIAAQPFRPTPPEIVSLGGFDGVGNIR